MRNILPSRLPPYSAPCSSQSQKRRSPTTPPARASPPLGEQARAISQAQSRSERHWHPPSRPYHQADGCPSDLRQTMIGPFVWMLLTRRADRIGGPPPQKRRAG